ncbi:DUF4113 domain-containing protein, partial [uncultured Aquabacterium sp.]|uniref:DUF4113 domain-containing protein n=1 Tax=uncultured Aquabacterium sp. TaxID=158753 RepID=UPI0026118B47
MDTTALTAAALQGLRSIYQPAEAGVMLLDLVLDSQVQCELLWDEERTEGRDRARLMEALDQVNDRFGKRTLLLGSSVMDQCTDTWGMKRIRRTPRYTTDWTEVPVARAVESRAKLSQASRPKLSH